MKWFFLFLLSLPFWGGGCHRKRINPPDANLFDTAHFTLPASLGILKSRVLAEVSGIAASRQNPGYLWAEEDSGNPNQIQLINPAGELAGQFTLPALDNNDWEDIAVGPGPVAGRSYVYLADVGDNMSFNPEKRVYRFPEPVLARKKLPVNESITNVQTLVLTMPDGAENAEAILLDPITKDIYVLTKGSDCRVYKAAYPQSLTEPTRMEPVITLPVSNVTSASLSPDGREILIRSYNQLCYYQRGPGQSVGEALKHQPRYLPLAFEPQGEAVAWALDGSGYYTSTERNKDYPEQFIYFYRRRSR